MSESINKILPLILRSWRNLWDNWENQKKWISTWKLRWKFKKNMPDWITIIWRQKQPFTVINYSFAIQAHQQETSLFQIYEHHNQVCWQSIVVEIFINNKYFQEQNWVAALKFGILTNYKCDGTSNKRDKEATVPPCKYCWMYLCSSQ